MNNETDFETVLNVYERHNVDSFSDLPGNYFWEEFFTACPKAKVSFWTETWFDEQKASRLGMVDFRLLHE